MAQLSTTIRNVQKMITQIRKGKHKHIVQFSPRRADHHEVREWCTEQFGPGGRQKRWRYGWTNVDNNYYFKSPRDAMIFTLRWGDA